MIIHLLSLISAFFFLIMEKYKMQQFQKNTKQLLKEFKFTSFKLIFTHNFTVF